MPGQAKTLSVIAAPLTRRGRSSPTTVTIGMRPFFKPCPQIAWGRVSPFATAVRKRRSFRGTGPLEAWLWRIVVNEARRLARERGPKAVEPPPPDPAANGRVPDELGVRAWIATLPPRQRAALFLRYYADLDYRSIAEALGVEVGTVSATLSAAHTTLRKALKEVEQ